MDLLHDWIVQEILSRLPVRSLMQCRSVCKLWRDLTTTRAFVRIHAAQSSEAVPGIMRTNFFYYHDGVYFPHHQFFFIDRRINAPIPTYFPVQIPITYMHQFNLMDSCKGLLLLKGFSNNYYWTLFVCNPLIRKVMALPDHERPTSTADHIHTDFDIGYCPKTGYFKVLETSLWVERSDLPNRNYLKEKYVYQVGDDLWNRIESDVHIITRRSGLGSNVNGAIHWIDQRWGASLTVFNLEDDVFKEMPGPVNGTGEFTTQSIGNCLSVINIHDNIIDVWIMKEYWICWEKYCVINVNQILNMDLEYNFLDYWVEGDEFLILHNHQIVTYHMKENVFKGLLPLEGYYRVIPHRDTLISPLVDGL